MMTKSGWGELQLRGIWKPSRPAFSVGRYVIFDEQVYKVLSSTHTHLQLEGLKFAVPAWQCRPQQYALQTKKPTYKPKGLVSAQEEILREGTDPNGDRNCLRSPGEVFPTAGEGLIGRTP
jgi:hypothetical protein